MSFQTIDVQPLTTSLGAEILGVDLARELDNSTWDEIHQAFLDHQVIFFRDQNITPKQQKSFGRRFGSLNVHPYVDHLPGHPEIIEVLKDVDDTRNFGGLWHTDLSFLEEPPLGSILYALEVPPAGGDTLFANQSLAYDRLSEGMKRMIDDLVVIHSAETVYGPAEISASNRPGTTSMKMDKTAAATGQVEHPLVRTHPETGRKLLYIGGNYPRFFKDMTVAESRPLLDFLNRHATREEFTCRFRWGPGSIAFWDNRCVQHYALDDYHGHRRRMHRVTINGDRPY